MEAVIGSSVPVFIGLTVVIMGLAAVLTGKAMAENWRPLWELVASCIGLGLADRFLHYALFEEQLLSLHAFLVDTGVLLVMALVAHRITLARKMVVQYPWLYERASLFTWRAKTR